MKKKILRALLVAMAVYALWLGVSVLSFKRYAGPETASVSPREAREPAFSPERRHSSLHEIEGVYHIHTEFSDGLKKTEEVIPIAASSGLDFIIITDHGNPNRESMAAEGRHHGILVLCGSELSTSRGHLVGLGFAPSPQPFSQNADFASREIARLGGFSVIAHPFSKTSWTWGEPAEYSGIELIDLDTAIKRNFFSRILYLPSLVLRPTYVLLKMLDPPTQALRKWDELNASSASALFGYFSADAHFFYRAAFSIFRLHVLLERPPAQEFQTARNEVFEALRRGRFYSAVEAAAEAAGFRFWAEREGTGETFPMGSALSLESRSDGTASSPDRPSVILKARAPFSFAAEMKLIYNGRTILSSRNGEIALIPPLPGTYRVEVFLLEKSPLRRDIPWIVSNPIFLRKEQT